MRAPLPSVGQRSREAEKMTRQDLIKPAVAALQAYDPHTRPGRVKLDANEHAYALPPAVREAVLAALATVDINRYPDPSADALRGALAQRFEVRPDMLLLGNGSDELVQMVLIACGRAGETVLTPSPTFSMYSLGAQMLEQRPVEVPLTQEWALDMPCLLEAIRRERPRVIFLASPNNPTANYFDSAALQALIEAAPGVIVIDEAYYDFCGRTLVPLLPSHPHLIIFRTLSKVGLAGLRVGILIANPVLVGEINKVRLPYNLNVYSQVAARVVLEHWRLITAQFQDVVRERERLSARLRHMSGVTVFPAQANFLLARFAAGGARVWEALGAQGILVRRFSGPPALQDCLRITVGTPDENDLLITTLEALLAQMQPLPST
jgi:histidinol-phosphate aminotransferase